MATITEDYCSYEVAQLLKEKGFDEICYLGYNKNGEYVPTSNRTNSQIIQPDYCFVCCPTLQMAMKWLRKKHNIHIWVEPNHDKEGLYNAHVKVGWWSNNWAGIDYNTHEKASEEAIKYCLENLI